MSRAVVILYGAADRAKATDWIIKSPLGTRVEFRASKRTIPQNDRMWAMLTDVAQQLKWHGLKLTPDDWKDLFTASLRRELRTVPNLTNDGFVLLGMRTSSMTKDEMSQLIELIFAFGAEHGVAFQESPVA